MKFMESQKCPEEYPARLVEVQAIISCMGPQLQGSWELLRCGPPRSPKTCSKHHFCGLNYFNIAHASYSCSVIQ